MNKIPPSVLREPPRHRSLMALIKDNEGNTEMAGGNCTRTFYLRCERKSLRDIESLPNELLVEVLVRLPAQDIYDSARLVCRKWYHMIHTHNFIDAHLQRAAYGLLFQSISEDSFFLVVREGRIEISKYKFKFEYEFNTSCNGLLLEFADWNYDNIYISNPATRQIFVLPPLVVGGLRYGLGIAYAAATEEYKVVRPYPLQPYFKDKCYILTVGVDSSWRPVSMEHIPFKSMQAFIRPPLMTEGFLHWCTDFGNRVLTFNVETEIFTEILLPVLGPNRIRNIFLPAGRYLSMFVFHAEFVWDVWEMEPETGGWRSVCSISLEAKEDEFRQLIDFKRCEFVIPVGWLKYLEVLVFRVNNPLPCCIFIYNILTQEMETMGVPNMLCSYSIIGHKNSLVWLGGC